DVRHPVPRVERNPASGPHRRSRGQSTSQAAGTFSPIVTPALYAVTAAPHEKRLPSCVAPGRRHDQRPRNRSA
ncbi:MAG TPA: hypothetical protein VGD71_28375, partial [Kribbella sp.]